MDYNLKYIAVYYIIVYNWFICCKYEICILDGFVRCTKPLNINEDNLYYIRSYATYMLIDKVSAVFMEHLPQLKVIIKW